MRLGGALWFNGGHNSFTGSHLESVSLDEPAGLMTVMTGSQWSHGFSTDLFQVAAAVTHSSPRQCVSSICVQTLVLCELLIVVWIHFHFTLPRCVSL